MLSPSKQWKHFAAMAVIGDGVMAVIHPKGDAEAWKAGPQWWRSFMEAFHERPALTRTVGALQIAAGIWWALSQQGGYEEKRDRS